MKTVNKLIGFSRGRRVNEVAGVIVGVYSAFCNKSLFCMDGFRIRLGLSVFNQWRLSECNLVCSHLQDKREKNEEKSCLRIHKPPLVVMNVTRANCSGTHIDRYINCTPSPMSQLLILFFLESNFGCGILSQHYSSPE